MKRKAEDDGIRVPGNGVLNPEIFCGRPLSFFLDSDKHTLPPCEQGPHPMAGIPYPLLSRLCTFRLGERSRGKFGFEMGGAGSFVPF